MRFLRILFLILAISVLLPIETIGQEIFYHGRNYGTEALYNPLSVLLNGSFDIIQLDGHSRSIAHFPYSAGFANVSRNVFNPFASIRSYGTGDFIRDELLPLNLTKAGAQWWPNYQLHLIGGGMTYRATAEWYALHGFPSPKLFSAGTMAAYHLLNEAVENENYAGNTVDPVADIWFFDLGGILLFSSDGVSRWFHDELHLADWSKQASFDVQKGTLENNGQYFSIKLKIPWQERFSLFYYFGMNGLTGLSYSFADGTALSVAGGLHAKKLVTVNAATRQQTMDLSWNAGVFYDRDNSLLISATVSGLTDNAADLNIYPGILQMGNFSPGFWMELRRDSGVLFGIATTWLPGLSATMH